MNKCLLALRLFTGLLFALPVAMFAQQKGDVIFKTDFDNKSDIDDWTQEGRMRVIDKEGVTSLRVNSGLLKYSLPLDKMKGCKIAVKYRLKAKDVSQPPQPWLGIKVMLHIVLPWDDIWQQTDLPGGSFEWRDEGFSTFIPAEAESAELIVGMEQVTGKVWVDKIDISIAEEPRKVNEANVHKGEKFTGHDAKRLRGFMVSTDIPDGDLRELAQLGANSIRWQITWNTFPYSPADTADIISYLQWLELKLKRIDEAMPLCRQLGLKVVIDLHTLPGGRYNGTMTNTLFQNKEWQDVFRSIWKDIAKRYKNEPAVWGYDLANEPEEGIVPDGVMNWNQLALATANDIREIDKQRAIIYEASPRGTQEALSIVEPLPVDGVVYSFHMYSPPQFTLQNAGGEGPGISYPGYINGKMWDIETMRKALSPIIKWQKDYNVQLYVGEFSAIRWAPGESAYYYINDCIRIFEEMGWDWAYHSYREWNGWSVEHGNNRNDNEITKEPTERKKMLLDWFKLNKQ